MWKLLRLLLPSSSGARCSVWVIVEIEFQTGKRKKREENRVLEKKGWKIPLKNVSRFDFSSSWLRRYYSARVSCRWCNFLEWFPLPFCRCARYFHRWLLVEHFTVQDQNSWYPFSQSQSRWQLTKNNFSPNLTLSHALWLCKHACHDKLEIFSL